MRRLILAAAIAATTAVGATAPATASAADTQAASADVCISPLGLTPCLESVICGLPHKVAVALGLDEYGIDLQMNCVH